MSESGLTRWAMLLALFACVACGPAPRAEGPPPPPAPTGAPPDQPPPPGPTAAPGAVPAPGSGGDTAQCKEPKPGPDYECVKACGPPVARAGDPDPGWQWLSAESARNRKQFGCPICLPGDARIATPDGDVPVRRIERGTLVFTLDEGGRKLAAPVVAIGALTAPLGHQLVHLVLDDGRELSASPGHPTVDGRRLVDLRVGDRIDGATVARTEQIPLVGGRTYDILPGGATGAYWADGVLVGSTLKKRTEAGPAAP